MATLSITTAELALVCDHLGAELPLQPAAEWAGLGDDARRTALAVARRSLAARGLLVEGSPTTELAGMVAAFVSPALLILVTAQRRGVTFAADSYSVTPEVSIAHRQPLAGVHLLEAIDTAGLRDGLLTSLGLEDRPEGGLPGDEISLDHATLVDWVTAPEDDHVVQGAGEQALLSAIRDDAVYLAVAVAHRPTLERVEGGRLAWFDGGHHGCWLVEHEPGAGSGGRDRVRVRPVAASWLGGELESFLPDAVLSAG